MFCRNIYYVIQTAYLIMLDVIKYLMGKGAYLYIIKPVGIICCAYAVMIITGGSVAVVITLVYNGITDVILENQPSAPVLIRINGTAAFHQFSYIFT